MMMMIIIIIIIVISYVMGSVHVCLLFNSEYPFAKHYDMDIYMD